MFNLIVLILKIILLPLSATKKEIVSQLCLQAKDLTLCHRKLKMQKKRIIFSWLDRLFYAVISKISSKFHSSLVKPATIQKWVRNFVKSFWTYPSKNKRPGRPETPASVKQIVLKMKNENIGWGYQRISDELQLCCFQL